MFNYGVFRKTLIDSTPAIAASALGLVAFVVLFVWSTLNMGTELMEFASKFPFLRKVLEMGLGVRLDGEISINILFAIGFTHLMVLMLTWSVIIATTTRVTVGEMERGTADLLLTMPVTRFTVFFSTTLVWLLAAIFLSFMPLVGVWLGIQLFDTKEPVLLSRFLAPACNFICLNIAIGGISTLAGCVMQRRGMAISLVGAVIFLSVVLNFVEPLVEEIGTWKLFGLFSLKHLSLLTYFRPVDTVRLNQWPIASMLILLGIGLVTWYNALLVFVRKDIPTA